MRQRDSLFYMQKALELARKGEGYTSPNPMVGAIVVKNDKIIGKGYHQCYGGPHAEAYALKEAGDKARDATLFVTLEPCSHFGKTPPCSEKVIKFGVKKAVIAMVDPNPEVAGSGIEQLKKAGIEVEVGVLEEEAWRLNEVFIKYITSKYPFVYLKTAQTLDGYLATKTGDSKWITNEKARLVGHQLRHRVDGIMVGINTVLNDDPSLTTRLPDKDSKDSIRIVIDSRLEMPLSCRIINQKSDAKTIIVTANKGNKTKKQQLQKKARVELLSVDLNKKGRIPLKEVLKELHKQGISSILVEGGGKVNHSFLQEGLVDKIYTFIAPKILGGSDGIASFSGSGPELMFEAKKLKGVEFQIMDNNILIIGKIQEESEICLPE